MKITFNASRSFAALIVLAAPVLFATSAFAYPDEVTNYNFTLGNVDFTTQYTYVTSPTAGDITVPGDYGVGTKPSQYNASWANVTPPKNYSGGSTNFLIADGSPKGTPQYVWEESLNVVKGYTYTVSDWAVNLDPAGEKTAQLFFGVNGTEVGGTTTLSSGNNWQFLSTTYKATSTGKVTLGIYDASNVHSGNDFGVDDIMFKVAAVPEASTIMTFALLCLGGLVVVRKRTNNSIC